MSDSSSSDPPRECGPCTACCTVFDVGELEKGPFETCIHVCESGCAIYADRPEPCRAFRCQWLRGLLEIDESIDPGLRPDVSGVVFDFQPQTPYEDVYTAWEFEPGASERHPAKGVIEGLQEHFLVMVVGRSPHGSRGMAERRFVGPRHLVERAEEASARLRF